MADRSIKSELNEVRKRLNNIEKKQQFFLMALFALCIVIPLVGGYNSSEGQKWWMMLPLATIVLLFLVFGILDRYRSQNK